MVEMLTMLGLAVLIGLGGLQLGVLSIVTLLLFMVNQND